MRGLEPVGNLVEAFCAGGLGHARVHVGVLVGLAGDGGLEVLVGTTDRQAGGRVTHGLEIFQVTVGVSGLTFRCGAEYGRHVIETFHVGLGGKIQITAVGLGFAGEGGLEVFLGFTAFEIAHVISSGLHQGMTNPARRVLACLDLV